MITLSNLSKTVTQSRKRVGRGEGSGYGKNAGKGHKGQTKHGGRVPIGFEGGQKRIMKRTPKFRGFKATPRHDLVVLQLGKLSSHYNDGDMVTVSSLLEKGLITTATKQVRVIGVSSIDKKITFEDSEKIYLTKGVKNLISK